MTKIIFGKSFATALKKLLKGNATLEKSITKKLEIFSHDPFDPQLRTHNLKGELKAYRSFSITHEIRVVFGTHDEVY